MVTTPPPTDPATAAIAAACWGPQPEPDPDPVEFGLRHALGRLLELGITHKLLCLIAHHAEVTDADLPRPVRRFLAGALRANRYKTAIYRREAVILAVSLDAHQIPCAALNGISAETRLYGGRGARQFSDLDLLVHPDQRAPAAALLVELGYHPSTHPPAMTRDLPDILIPAITVDLTTAAEHASTPDEIHQALARRQAQTLPDHDYALPVLATHDALTHCLTRIDRRARTTREPPWAACADALRLHRTGPPARTPTTPTVQRGWQHLRRIWPELPPTPFPTTPTNPSDRS